MKKLTNRGSCTQSFKLLSEPLQDILEIINEFIIHYCSTLNCGIILTSFVMLIQATYAARSSKFSSQTEPQVP
jgi:hypothetical protein